MHNTDSLLLIKIKAKFIITLFDALYQTNIMTKEICKEEKSSRNLLE